MLKGAHTQALFPASHLSPYSFVFEGKTVLQPWGKKKKKSDTVKHSKNSAKQGAMASHRALCPD